MQSNEKPKLPSIQSMLEGISLDEVAAVNRSRRHRRHASELSAFKPFVDQKNTSEASMSGQLEKLSIQPMPIEPKIDDPPNKNQHVFHHLPFRPHLSSYRHNLHSRSYSDHTHPYPTTTPSTVTRHRRTVSTNTFDLLLHRPTLDPPLPLLCTSSSSSSTTHAPSSPQTPTEDETDSEGSSETERRPSGVKPPCRKRRPPPSKRYDCSHCAKAFSRPSSLRIHIYSHTGERPFACPEKGCHRKFSVQSNMRRHLRVHGTHRSSKRNPSGLEKPPLIHKPLAAKPILGNPLTQPT